MQTGCIPTRKKCSLNGQGPLLGPLKSPHTTGNDRIHNATVCNYKAATLKDDGLC